MNFSREFNQVSSRDGEIFKLFMRGVWELRVFDALQGFYFQIAFSEAAKNQAVDGFC